MYSYQVTSISDW